MEKLRFTLRFIVLLAALPVIMFAELTRKDKVTTEQKHKAEKASVVTNDEAILNHSPFMQAVYN